MTNGNSRMFHPATFAATLLAVAFFGWCSLPGKKEYRRITGMDLCMAMPVYQGPNGPFIGHLTGGAIVDVGTQHVPAIDLDVEVDGRLRSVWRRRLEVMKWYVPPGLISPKECHWTYPGLLPVGKWQPTNLEIGLDVRLWHRLRGNWTLQKSLFALGDSISPARVPGP